MILVKLGGSLINFLDKISSELKRYKNLVIIPGGSIFSRFIREVQKKYYIKDDTAHILAILSMEQYGYLINEYLNFNLVYNLEEIKPPCIIMPYNILKDDDFLEKSWNITSDSISCYIAYKLGLRKVIKLTDVDGIYLKGRLVDKIYSEKLLEMKFKPVDEYLPIYIKKFGIHFQIVNGKRVETVRKALSGEDIGTTIYP